MAPHPQRLTVTRRGWALARPFTTAHGVETTADVVIAEISDGDARGRGECVPLPRFGESIDKAGGLTEALALAGEAKRRGFRIMVGGMIGTSLGIAPALLIAQQAEIVDLDGPLLLASDRVPGLHYDGSTIHPPDPNFWG